MLLQYRAVLALGIRMCSTQVTKGPLMDKTRPSSGKMKGSRFIKCFFADFSLRDKVPKTLSCVSQLL